MPLRRVAIDWDDLEVALTSDSLEWAWFLDLRTGAVHMVGSEEEGPGPSREEIEEVAARGDAVRVFSLESRVEYGWMAEFTEAVDDPGLRDRLQISLAGRGAFRRFKNVLANSPAERERWFAFRDERLRRAMRAWLADHGIEPTTEPLARRGSRGRRGEEGVSL
jgi:hypothetical protein